MITGSINALGDLPDFNDMNRKNSTFDWGAFKQLLIGDQSILQLLAGTGVIPNIDVSPPINQYAQNSYNNPTSGPNPQPQPPKQDNYVPFVLGGFGVIVLIIVTILIVKK